MSDHARKLGIYAVDAKGLDFASDAFVGAVEHCGLLGCWKYQFADRTTQWSPGLFRLLGLGRVATRPSFGIFADLLHPDDRADVRNVMEHEIDWLFKRNIFRVIRPNGTMRILSSRAELYLCPDGRPESASGVVFDITDTEQLAMLQSAEQRRRLDLFRESGAVLFSINLSGEFSFPQEAFELTGVSPDEVADDAFLIVDAEERNHWRLLSLEARNAGVIHTSQPLIHVRRHGRSRFETFAVPVRDASGLLVDWCILAQPASGAGPIFMGALQEGVEQAVDGRHVRAARGLLDWSMTDLARASQLSLSTVRRAEEHMAGTSPATRHRIVHALTRFGVRFSLLSDAPNGTVCVMKSR